MSAEVVGARVPKAWCDDCAWQGPNRRSKAAAQEDAEAHNAAEHG